MAAWSNGCYCGANEEFTGNVLQPQTSCNEPCPGSRAGDECGGGSQDRPFLLEIYVFDRRIPFSRVAENEVVEGSDNLDLAGTFSSAYAAFTSSSELF